MKSSGSKDPVSPEQAGDSSNNDKKRGRGTLTNEVAQEQQQREKSRSKSAYEQMRALLTSAPDKDLDKLIV